MLHYFMIKMYFQPVEVIKSNFPNFSLPHPCQLWFVKFHSFKFFKRFTSQKDKVVFYLLIFESISLNYSFWYASIPVLFKIPHSKTCSLIFTEGEGLRGKTGRGRGRGARGGGE